MFFCCLGACRLRWKALRGWGSGFACFEAFWGARILGFRFATLNFKT